MTKNKLDDSIRSNMLDELLSDVDKPKPPARQQSGRNYSGQDSFDWGSGDDMPRSFLDDDGPDPMDAGYNNYHGFNRGRSEPPVRKSDSVFNRRTSHENVVPSVAHDDFARQVANLLRTCHQEGRRYVLEPAERDELVAILMKMIGVQLDKVGIVWGTEGLKAFRETLKDLVPMAYFGTTRFTMMDDEPDYEDGRFGKTPSGTVYDRETGEVIGEEEDLEERLAIMEENAGHE